MTFFQARLASHFSFFVSGQANRLKNRLRSIIYTYYIHIAYCNAECVAQKERITFGLPSGVHSRLWALFWATSPLARANRSRKEPNLAIFDVEPITLSLVFSQIVFDNINSLLVEDASPSPIRSAIQLLQSVIRCLRSILFLFHLLAAFHFS